MRGGGGSGGEGEGGGTAPSQGQPPREALNTASRRAPTSTTDASLFLSFLSAWHLQKLNTDGFILGELVF